MVKQEEQVAYEAERAYCERLAEEFSDGGEESFGDLEEFEEFKANLAYMLLHERQSARDPLEARIRELEAEVARLKTAAVRVIDERTAHSTSLDYGLYLAIDDLRKLVDDKEEA